MKRHALYMAVLVALSVGATQANANPTLFTFDDGALAVGDGDLKVSAYMGLSYPSWVLTNGAEVHTGDGFHSNLYLWTRLQLLNPGNLRVWLDVPTTSVAFDAYVFKATTGADFTFTAYDQKGQIILRQSWDAGVNGVGYSYASGPLPMPAYSLNFSDNGRHDVGIDNLLLTPVPVPGAALLGLIGVLLVGRLRRRVLSGR